MSNTFDSPLQELQFYDKYSRWNAIAGRRETWGETCLRVHHFFYAQIEGADNVPPMQPTKLTATEWNELFAAMLNMEVMPSMRIVQMAGPALERCNVGAYNCAYLPLDSWQAFGELLYILMQGTGCGFSCEADYIDSLPRIKKQKGSLLPHVIPDTTEGWCHALVTGLMAWAAGMDITFDYSQIRPQGAVLRTKGGRASGPEPLRQLLDFTRNRLLAKQGRRVDPIDAHDIACFAGQIVQVGGVRRAAEISLSDLEDRDLRDAKTGNWTERNIQRSMANNSAVYNGRPASVDFLEEWIALAKSGSGERGIFNREGTIGQRPSRRSKRSDFGTNPCGEIVLRPRQFCNLSIAIARPDDTEESLTRKVRIAAIYGTLQSTLTKFNYLSQEWQANCEEERLLGVDITGQMDCPLLQPKYGYGDPWDDEGAYGRRTFLSKLRDVAIATNKDYAGRLGIPASAAVTCVKPSGNSAQLFNCSSGLHPRYAKFYIRRVRIGAYTPIAKFLKDADVPWHPEVGQSVEGASVLVFDFPVASPEDAITRHDMGAVEQLENWFAWKEAYTEHNPSVTIYIDEAEWLEAGNWVYQHFDRIGGLAFLPKDQTAYTLAPYEEITKEQYDHLSLQLPPLLFDRLADYEKEDMTEVNREFACTGDRCEI